MNEEVTGTVTNPRTWHFAAPGVCSQRRRLALSSVTFTLSRRARDPELYERPTTEVLATNANHFSTRSTHKINTPVPRSLGPFVGESHP